MISRLLAVAVVATTSPQASPVKSGHASAEWIRASAAAEPGKPVDTAIRLRIEEGWHIYWSNPGEGGMKTSFDWKLPPGWTADALAQPAPSHFLTGGLGSFGYAGTVLFPLRLTPPADFRGTADLAMTVSWLACDDGACVPGEARLVLSLAAGAPTETAGSAAIREAWKSTPGPAPEGLELEVVQGEGGVTCLLRGSDKVELAGAAAFPLTPQALDSSRVMRFEKSAVGWTARIGVSEYAALPLRELALLVVPAGGGRPFEMSWRAKSDSTAVISSQWYAAQPRKPAEP